VVPLPVVTEVAGLKPEDAPAPAATPIPHSLP
jgi:hypothetical protein